MIDPEKRVRSGSRRRARRLAASAGLLLAAASTLASCGRDSEQSSLAFPSEPAGQLEIRYPMDETLFPPEIVAPTFVWSDETEGVESWQILLRFAVAESTAVHRANGTADDVADDAAGQPAEDAAGERFQFSSAQPHWRPSEADWREIKRRSEAREAEVAIVGLDPSAKPVSAATVRIQTSRDPIGDSIFYREVPLPFIEAVQDPSRIRWRHGSIDSESAPPIVLENLPVCGNCHSFSGDGSVLGLDVDYGNDKGGYAILPVSSQMVMNDEKIISWSDYEKDDDEATFGLLSQVSPDGRYVVSTVKDRAVFVATPELAFSQLFFPIKGILVVYDTQTRTYRALPGADDPDYVQSNPTWSPDGKEIVFARATAYRKDSIANAKNILLDEKDVPEFIEDKEPFKFDLYRVPFNEGRGGTAKPIEGASHDGMSNFFAKFSPDGKWIVFCKAENYMLLMPDSELYIVPAAGGEARRLRANTPLMNSWHSWSSNGRWLVFSSKANTPYTQLFLTHIDDEGRSTPPVVLERFTSQDRAANIPEFVPLASGAIAKIEERFLDAYSFLRAGMANERTGDYDGAVRSYRRGLEVAPENVELWNALGFSLFQQGKSQAAVDALEKALSFDPKHAKAHNNMALASIDLGELEMAEAHYRESIAIEAQSAIHNDLGFVLERQGLHEEAQEQYRAALALDPASDSAHFNLAAALARNGDLAGAEKHFRAALAANPSARAYAGLGIVLGQQDRADDAIANLRQAIEADPNDPAAYDSLGSILVEQGRLEEAASNYRQLTRIRPGTDADQKLADALARLARKDGER